MDEQPKEIRDQLHIVLNRKVAQGGMSVVYEGHLIGPVGFQKKVAVKTLLPKWGGNDRFMELFIAEAKLVSDLVHENIVQILHLGRLAEGTYYIVMEFVDGLPLRDFMSHHVKTGRRIPVPLTIHIASRIARGLAYAHGFRDRLGRRMEIVHRDVCPNNVLITTEGLSKLTDFGVAKALSLQIIGDGWLTGKARYMAPEQAARKPVDFRADQYALGAVLFEMLAGRPVRPAEADPRVTPFDTLAVPWDLLPPDTSPEIQAILRRLLEPAPDTRWSETSDLAKALEYEIYKDGYGPTIQTVEAYLREHFPHLYRREKLRVRGTILHDSAFVDPDMDTMIDGG